MYEALTHYMVYLFDVYCCIGMSVVDASSRMIEYDHTTAQEDQSPTYVLIMSAVLCTLLWCLYVYSMYCVYAVGTNHWIVFHY